MARSSASPQSERNRQDHIQLSPLKTDGAELLRVLDEGGMAAVLSGMELMYLFEFRLEYQCFIHKLEAEDGRRKSFEINERNRAMFKNLDSAADAFFEIRFRPGMDPVGVMMAAECGIISYLDHTGRLPAEDFDFMQWQEPDDDDNKEEISQP